MLEQKSPTADEGRLRLLFQGDAEHAAFDNISWLSDRTVAVVEDRGDTFHSQGNGVQPTALDSAWAIDANVDHSHSAAGLTRFIAEGRDASATVDSALLDADTPGFTNDGDNELTGIHTSDGDPTVGGILGAKDPEPFAAGDDHGRRGRGHDGDRGLAVAGLLHPAARRQPHLGARPQAVAGAARTAHRGRGGRTGRRAGHPT